MVSDSLKCVFVHVPKTGGSSIRRLFEHRDRSATHFDHLSAAEYVREMGEETFRSYFSFGFVRNPFDRVLSLYTQPRGKWETLTDEHKAALTMPFKRWLRYLLDNFGGTRKRKRRGLYRSQVDFLTDGVGGVLVDRVCRFEDLYKEWRYVRQRIGMHGVTLPWVARSPRSKRSGSYRKYYDPESREFVRKLYGQDLDFFGYEF